MRPFHSVAAIALSAVLSTPLAFAQLKSDQKIDNADAAAMKQLAQANLNEIQEHLQLAQRIAQSAGAGASSSTPSTQSTPVTPSSPATPSSGGEVKPNINFSK